MNYILEGYLQRAEQMKSNNAIGLLTNFKEAVREYCGNPGSCESFRMVCVAWREFLNTSTDKKDDLKSEGIYRDVYELTSDIERDYLAANCWK